MKRTWVHWEGSEERGARNEDQGPRTKDQAAHGPLAITNYELQTMNYKQFLREATQVKNIWVPYGE